MSEIIWAKYVLVQRLSGSLIVIDPEGFSGPCPAPKDLETGSAIWTLPKGLIFNNTPMAVHEGQIHQKTRFASRKTSSWLRQ